MRDTILCGDALQMLKTMPDRHVQTVVTSPPYYALRDYGVEGQIGLEATPEEYIANLVAVFQEVRRVLRDDGTLWVNIGDSYANDEKWGGHPSGKRCKALHKFDRPRRYTGLQGKNLLGIPWRLAFALQADDWILRSDIIWHKPACMPESVTDRPTKSHEYLFLLAKSASYYYDAEAIKEPARDWGTRDRTSGKYTSGLVPIIGGAHSGLTNSNSAATGRNKRTVWTVNPQPYSEAHFATFPPKLIEPCVLAGSRPGDIVLDPFMGAGTTALVALRHNRSYLGIELNPAYVELITARIAEIQPELWSA